MLCLLVALLPACQSSVPRGASARTVLRGLAEVQEASEAPPVPSPEEERPSQDPRKPRRSNAPLDDAEARPPGTLEPELDVVRRDPANWLGIPPEDELLNLIRDPLRQLDQDHGIAITGAYTMLYQRATKGPGRRDAASGDFDLFLRWTAIGRDTPDTGTFFAAGEYRHAIGPLAPAELGTEIGSLIPTVNGFSDRGWAFKEAYFVQRLFDDKLRVALGRIDPENVFGGHKLQSANTSFLNKAFSGNPAIAYPGAGATAAMSIRPTETFYVGGGFSNGYGSTTSNELDKLFEEWDLLTFAETGFTPTIEGLGEGRYRLALWHVDELQRTDRPSDQGFSLIVDQAVGEELSLFARYGHAAGDVTDVDHLLEAGGAWKGLFGSAEDLTGLAGAWASPKGGRHDEQIVEAFHRLQLSGRTQLTIGAQLILNPSDAPEHDAVGVFSVRFRITF